MAWKFITPANNRQSIQVLEIIGKADEYGLNLVGRGAKLPALN
jgi:hypothetical protein